ncbi:hypothetical protein [Actinoplanes regularis]|uniref:Tetratricopeptide repeat-containing protein n=1 Tax=Actinoplanes regularis TaxID=52697 RepID=A0A239I674_9ACTN|nr:hypothetical protein [Actinoplanes regularis]GIE91327.1 hypothetical protein Are01nite_78070 [Actinoplanes regularis]SNS89067.1 hypothetical protein SAMN06264365_127105 [Actinoplanes regularis]
MTQPPSQQQPPESEPQPPQPEQGPELKQEPQPEQGSEPTQAAQSEQGPQSEQEPQLKQEPLTEQEPTLVQEPLTEQEPQLDQEPTLVQEPQPEQGPQPEQETPTAPLWNGPQPPAPPAGPYTPQQGWPQQPQPGIPQQGWPQQPQPGIPQQPGIPPQQGWPQPAWQPQPAPQGWHPQQGWQQTPPPMIPPPMVPAPPKEPRKADRLAVAAANASFLSIGYFMMRRVGLGLLTLLISFVLMFFVVPSVHTVLIEVVAVLWWLAMIAHGYFLAQGPVEPTTRLRQRVLGISAAVVVLLVLGLLRVQAAGIGQTVADAKAGGDCTHALEGLDKVWLGLRIANAPLAAEGDDTVTACRQLNDAGERLTSGLSGDVADLNSGFNQLNTVLTTKPGHEKMADSVLDRFLAGLPTSNPCETVEITRWLGQRAKTNNTLDRSADVVAQHEPNALLGCADSYMTAQQWTSAQTVYQQLVNAYPADPNKARAEAGIAKAGLAIELDTLKDRTSGSSPEYCGNPSKYSAAKAYRKGVNRAMFFGNSTESGRLPSAWKTTNPEAATLVVCLGSDTQGAAVRTCDYRSSFGTGGLHSVTFHKVKISVKGYEIKTGKLVINQTLQFGGSSCPATVRYTSSFGIDTGPPRHMTVTVDAKDVRAQFQKLIVK